MLGFFDKYPYTDFHELNLDWLLKAVKELAEEIHDFEIVNQFTYEGSWDITKQYKKFAIVTVNGTEGYISLQPVPAGIAITNTDYWAMVADYTAVVAGLSARITALEGKVSYIESRLGVDYNSVVWIGDSYTSAGSLGADVDKRFSTVVSNQLGLTEHNYAVGGTGYMYGSTPYTTQINNAVTDFMNHGYDRTKVKYVFIMGNRNDADGSYSFSDYMNAVYTVFTTAHNYFINAKLIVIPALWDAKPCKQQMIRYSTIINEVSGQMPDYNVLFVDHAWTWLMGNEDKILWQSGVDVHPNVEGHKIIAQHVLNILAGNDYSDIKYFEFTPSTLNAAVSDCKVIIRVLNGIAYFQCRFKTSSATITGNIFEDVVNHLYLSNLFIISTQVFCTVGTRLADVKPQVTVNQVLNKTGDSTGTLTTNAYVYSGQHSFDTTDYNWIEFQVPYGIQRDTYN